MRHFSLSLKITHIWLAGEILKELPKMSQNLGMSRTIFFEEELVKSNTVNFSIRPHSKSPENIFDVCTRNRHTDGHFEKNKQNFCSKKQWVFKAKIHKWEKNEPKFTNAAKDFF